MPISSRGNGEVCPARSRVNRVTYGIRECSERLTEDQYRTLSKCNRSRSLLLRSFQILRSSHRSLVGGRIQRREGWTDPTNQHGVELRRQDTDATAFANMRFSKKLGELDEEMVEKARPMIPSEGSCSNIGTEELASAKTC